MLLSWDKGKHGLCICYEKGDWLNEISKVLKGLKEKLSSLKLEEPVYKRMDSLVSLLPSVPLPAQQVLASSNSGLHRFSMALETPSKLSQLLPLYEQVFDLENQLFKLPVELEQLIPQYCQSLPQSYMVQIYNRIQELKKRLEDLKNHHDHIDKFMKKEKLITKAAQMIKEGHLHIGNLSSWIGKVYPKSSVDPNAPQFRLLTGKKIVQQPYF